MADQAKRKTERAGQDAAPANSANSAEPNPTETLLARLEDLLDAFWPAAAIGDVKSGELVLRVLRQQSDLYGLRGRVALPADEGVDELAKLRARRAAP